MVKKIAVTGGIGSGKSLVLQCAKELGFPTFSCDEIYKRIIHGKEYVEKIKSAFPNCIVENGVDRKKLAEIIFNNPVALQKLNNIAHPIIMNTLYQEMEKLSDGIVFAEVPLLFEGGYENDFHETIYVKRNIEDRIRATIQRDQTDRQAVLKRIQTQFDAETEEGRKKLQNCGAHILENNQDVAHIKIWLQNFIYKCNL